jgi:hypothetical protein
VKRHIATVATDNCRRGLSILVASLRARGWRDSVRVYVPEGDPLPELPGTRLVRGDFWWRGTSLTRCRNHAALLKCGILFDPVFEPGDSVLYMDGADTAMLGEPGRLFELFEMSGRPLAAHPFCHAVLNKHKHPALLEKAHLVNVYRDVFDRRAPYYNNGVWLFRAGREAALLGRWWQALEISEATHGVVATNWDDGEDNKLVGDQQTFNLMLRLLDDPLFVLDLPAEWNFRGGTRVAECAVQNRRATRGGSVRGVFHPRLGRVRIAHSSGPYEMPGEIVDFATFGSDTPVVPGGVGLAGAV